MEYLNFHKGTSFVEFTRFNLVFLSSMGFLKAVATTFWRIWFYILMIIPILFMLPFLLLFTSSKKFYPQYFVCARIWAKSVLYGMGFYPQCLSSEKMVKGKSYMLVANHASMIDIMLILAVIKQPFVFVGKKELTRVPLFGFFYKRTVILVDRKCQKSKQQVIGEGKRRLEQGNSICIFPEGGVPNDKTLILDTFKDGAFRLAIEQQIPIVPLTFHDTKNRFPYSFFSGGPGKLRVKIHHFISTRDKAQTDRKSIRQETREVILNELKNPSL